eukprot:2888677-Pyramimonas_sp.AAC.1
MVGEGVAELVSRKGVRSDPRSGRTWQRPRRPRRRPPRPPPTSPSTSCSGSCPGGGDTSAPTRLAC